MASKGFRVWEITERVRPLRQLEYRSPVLYSDEYTLESVRECEKPDSNQGPAAESAEKSGESV